MNGVGPDKNYKFRFVEILENPTHTAPNRARGREGAHLILVGRSRPGRAAAACGAGALTSRNANIPLLDSTRQSHLIKYACSKND